MASLHLSSIVMFMLESRSWHTTHLPDFFLASGKFGKNDARLHHALKIKAPSCLVRWIE